MNDIFDKSGTACTTSKCAVFDGLPCCMTPHQVLSEYNLHVLKEILSYAYTEIIVNTITDNNDEQLALGTINAVMCAAIELCEGITQYIPYVQEDGIYKVLDTAIKCISDTTLHDIMISGKLTCSLEVVLSKLNNVVYNSAKDKALVELRSAFSKIHQQAVRASGVCLGHDIASSDTPAVMVQMGNAIINSMTNTSCNTDLRAMSFLAAEETTTNAYKAISKGVKECVIASVSNDKYKTLIEGANYGHPGAGDRIKQYISEVTSACNNLECTMDAFKTNNYDLDCAVTETLVEEGANHYPNVTNNQFGWNHASLITENIAAVHRLCENILGLKEGQLKEDILLTTKATPDSEIDRAQLALGLAPTPVAPPSLVAPAIDGKNLQYVLGTLAMEPDCGNRRVIAERLAESFCNTMAWQAETEGYQDIPAKVYLNRSCAILESLVKNTQYYVHLTESMKIFSDKLQECGEPCTFNPCPTMNELTPAPATDTVAGRRIQLAFNEIVRASNDGEMDAAMFEFTMACNAISIEENVSYVDEASKAGKVARKAARKVQKAEEKIIRKHGGAAGEVKSAVKNAIEPMEKYVTQMYQKLKKADSDERREIIIKGGVAPKVIRWVKRGIGLAVGAAVGTIIPAASVVTGIALLGFIATDKKLDAREKRKILAEIDDELTIVNEKIDDSRSDENKQNKYELMRIRNELTRQRQRIVLNLKA